ncbi:MAG: non-canonical purine NTP pyrophosphatase [Nanoarchaeota archaeon]|nr:non-canonical purine NTP pyrophosphatase [Nanoarchaeota archaeon]
MEKKIYLLTKNKGKLLAAKKIFEEFGIEIGSIEKEFPEIQESSSLKIAKFSTEAASKEFNVAVLREDHSLYIEALQYFPGPFTAFFDKNMEVKVLLKILQNFENRNAEMELGASLTIPGHETFESVYRVSLEISKEIKGEQGNWDKVLKLRGSEKTFSESTEEENVDIWIKNYKILAKKFLEVYNSQITN